MRIANPIYDVVFKYLMEDQESAKLLLSKILQEEVVELDFLPQESTIQLDENVIEELPKSVKEELHKEGKLNVYLQRLDFTANIKTQEGELKKVLIEVQKAKYLAQIERFRRYIGNAYLKQDADGEERPIIAIYFLGETLPDVPAAVLGIGKKFMNKTTQKETFLPKKVKFIDFLIHEGIVVQIPRLGSHHQSKLEEFLSVFDQKKIEKGNPHFLDLDPETYPEQYRVVMRRLQHAACEKDLQRSMDLEDEVQKVFAAQDKKLEEEERKGLEKDKKLEEKDKELNAEKKMSKQKDQALEKKDQALEKKDRALEKKDRALVNCVLALQRSGMSMEKIMQETGLSHNEIQTIIQQKK